MMEMILTKRTAFMTFHLATKKAMKTKIVIKNQCMCSLVPVVLASTLMVLNGILVPSGLKPRAAESFSNPFGCLAVCGGIDFDLVNMLARSSNEYAQKYLLPKDRNGRLHGQASPNITVEEMYHFLGITLRISLSPIDWGGYEAYFSSRNRSVLGVEMYETEGFARKFMSLNRCKQIRAAFHPEDRLAGLNGDKCSLVLMFLLTRVA
jgi:hypothetical protein